MMKKTQSNESIAVVGISGRFPKAQNLKEFWKLLSNGEDAVTEISKERWNSDAYYDPDRSKPEKTNQKHAAFLEDIHDFDPLFFNISPAEAIEMSPSQKLTMELAYETIESTNIPFQSITGSKAGVYIGNIWNDYEHERKHKNALITSHSALGQSANVIANRISYSLGLRGPSLVVDTGCSSSLVAIHLACQSLWDGSTNLAFAGAVNHLLDPDQYVYLTKFGGLSSSGRCRAFDSEADGFVRGEGGAIILLKRLSEAEKDGDKIYAIIKGSAINNNGYNANLPATSVEGQKEVLKEAYDMAGIDPKDVHYIEAHGTGTKLGDPTEATALGEFFGQQKNQKLHIGSVKTNVGHLEGAAGMAGLIKVILAMNEGKIPGNIHFNKPNPNIDLEKLNLKVHDTLDQWPTENGETFKAGVNSFGWGGTNSHVVLEEYRPASTKTHQTELEEKEFMLPISARSESALREYVKAYILFLNNEINGKLSYFSDLSIASAVLKPNFEYRAVFSGKNKHEVITAMHKYLNSSESISPAKEVGKGKTVFIFPGQGSQWLGMGRDLYQNEEVFKTWMDRCDTIFAQFTSWSVLDQLYTSEEKLKDIDVIQPAICAVQISLAELWKSKGLVPDSVVGHSMGEVAAAYIAGAISLHDAANVICTRSKLMRTVSGNGAMAVTELTLEQAEETITRYPELSIAVSNSPKSTVLAGTELAVKDMLLEMEERGLFARQIKVDVASHSKQMDPLKEDLRSALEGIWPTETKVGIYSTVEARKMEGASFNADYWVSNLRNGVQFSTVMQKLVEDEHTVFVEVSPHPVLTTAINECLEAHGAKNSIVNYSIHKEYPEIDTFNNNLIEIFVKGKNINWSQYYGVSSVNAVSLPTYPFQRETYRIKERTPKGVDTTTSNVHPFLGQEVNLGGLEHITYWNATISLEELDYLKGYVSNGIALIPKSFYLETMLAAIKATTGSTDIDLQNVKFNKALACDQNETFRFQVKMTSHDSQSSIQCFYLLDGDKGDKKWVLVAEAEYNKEVENKTELRVPDVSNLNWKKVYEKQDIYSSMKSIGLDYEEKYKGLSNLKRSKEIVYAELKLSESQEFTKGNFVSDPILLDNCFQAVLAKRLESKKDRNIQTTFVTGISRVQLLKEFQVEPEMSVVANLSPFECKGPAGTISTSGDIYLLNSEKIPVLVLKSVTIEIRATKESPKTKPSYYHIKWHKNESKKKPTRLENEQELRILFSGKESEDTTLTSHLTENRNIILAKHGEAFKQHQSEQGNIWFELDYNDDSQINELFKTISEQSSINLKGVILSAVPNQFNHDIASVSVDRSKQLIGLVNRMSSSLPENCQLIFITQNVQHAIVDNELINVQDAPLQGLVRTFRNEKPQYVVKTIDLGIEQDDISLNALVEEIQRNNSEQEVSIREGKAYYARLERHIPKLLEIENISFSKEGYYLVTGFNDISFSFTKWMFEHGARKFLLVENDNTPEAFMDKVDELRSAGAQLSIKNIELSNYDALATVVKGIENDTPLKGIIHDVGYVPSIGISELSGSAEALSREINSAWNLHRITQEMPVERFILLSSISSLTGAEGHGNYVASSAFLDQLAHFRRQLDLPAICINWGGVSRRDVVNGITSTSNLHPEIEDITCVKNTTALNAFGRLDEKSTAQLGIFSLNMPELEKKFPDIVKGSLFTELMKDHSPGEDMSDDISLVIQLLPTFEDKLECAQNFIAKSVAQIIKADKSRISASMTFKGLGVDSLMAVRLRNQLEKDFKIQLSVADFWANPTIKEYAEFIIQKLDSNSQGKTGSSKGASPVEIVNPQKETKLRLICFHDAGGNSSLYQDWAGILSSGIELITVELPGRGKRSEENPYLTTEHFVADVMPSLLPLLDKPFAFFGHSMGGSLSYIITKELQKINANTPELLIMSSMPHHSMYNKEGLSHDMTDKALVAEFPHLSEKNIPDNELRILLLNLLRKDLQLLNDYKWVKNEAMNIPIVALHGLQDGRVSSEDMLAWEHETNVRFQMIERNGGHHYIHNDLEYLEQLLGKELGDIIGKSKVANY